MAAFISLIFIAGMLIFFIASAAVVFHFAHYRIGKYQHQMILSVFVVGALALMIAEFLVYSGIQWDVVNEIINERILKQSL